MKRFFEVLPGLLAWTTLILMVLFSWLLPTQISIFIILFDIYWLLKTIYLSLHLRATFSEMKRVMKVNWLEKITPDMHHLVILPMFDEPYEVVRESFESLLRANYPKDKLLVVLALEERAGEKARLTGEAIQKEYAP